eukprot:s2439_g4.t1
MILDDAGDAGDVQDVCIPADDGDDGDNDVDDADSGEEEDDDVNDRDDGDGRYNDGGDCDDNGCRANDDSDESVLTMMMIPTDFTTVMLMMTLDGGFSLTTLLTVVTWMTLEKAKHMLFEVLHPAAEALRSDAFLVEEAVPDADAKEAEQVGPRGLVAEEKEKDILVHQAQRRIGLGSNVEDAGDNKPAECAYPLESVDITLATMEDMQCVHKHLNDLRIATGVAPVLQDGVLKVYGSGKKLVRAQQLVQTLLETGEWVAFSEAFVLSEETKQKRRASDGPSTQLLIKLPECIGIKVVEKHLASMELAAEADQLKLSSKPVGGKRTLMVEGPPKAHERVKLMVKELMERGQSAMLTKFLNGSRAGTARPAPAAPPAEAAPKAPPQAVVASLSSVRGRVTPATRPASAAYADTSAYLFLGTHYAGRGTPTGE